MHAPGIPGTLSPPLRKPLVSDHGMHHVTCATHVPWCMSGSLTRGGGENDPGIPGACATRNITYMARGPWELDTIMMGLYWIILRNFHLKLMGYSTNKTIIVRFHLLCCFTAEDLSIKYHIVRQSDGVQLCNMKWSIGISWTTPTGLHRSRIYIQFIVCLFVVGFFVCLFFVFHRRIIHACIFIRKWIV